MAWHPALRLEIAVEFRRQMPPGWRFDDPHKSASGAKDDAYFPRGYTLPSNGAGHVFKFDPRWTAYGRRGGRPLKQHRIGEAIQARKGRRA